jgi:hypothetical protein
VEVSKDDGKVRDSAPKHHEMSSEGNRMVFRRMPVWCDFSWRILGESAALFLPFATGMAMGAGMDPVERERADPPHPRLGRFCPVRNRAAPRLVCVRRAMPVRWLEWRCPLNRKK